MGMTSHPGPLIERFLGRPLPSSDESERAILGGILLDNRLMSQAVEHLTAEDFYAPLHRRIFAAMMSLFDASRKIDPILVGEELKKDGPLELLGGIAVITNLTFGLPHFNDLQEYIEVVSEKSKLRHLIYTASTITEDSLAEELPVASVIDRAEQRIFDISRTSRGDSEYFEIGSLVEGSIRAAENASGKPRGISTGLIDLDSKLGGLESGNLIVAAGRPGMGKTAFALQIAASAAACGNRVAIFSLEMEGEEVTDRIIAATARVNLQDYRTGKLLGIYREKMHKCSSEVARLPIAINDSGSLTIMQLRAKARRIAARYKKLNMIIVDYIQLLSGSSRKNESRRLEIEEISRGLKLLAKEFNVPVIALSQLSRGPENRNSPRPVLSDLRESGSIEQDADVVLLLFRPGYYNAADRDKPAEIIVAKQRNGPAGTVYSAFHETYARFENLVKEESSQNGSDS